MHARTGQQSVRHLLDSPIYCPQCHIVFGACKLMNYRNLIKEIVGTYQKHGWQFRRALLRSETSVELKANAAADPFSSVGAEMQEAAVDALWFSRPSTGEREAWELRLLAENPFALFETFEKDEPEEEREERRREMEAQMRDYGEKQVVSDV